MPESPVWLRSKNRHKEADQSMAWLKLVPPPSRADNKTATRPEPAHDARDACQQKVTSSYFVRPIMMPLSIGLTLLVLQQISGIDSIIFFTVEIFRAAGK